MATETKTLTFRGLNGFAGFRQDRPYEVEITTTDDGSGDVYVSLPHAPGRGPAKFDAKQWAEWWNKK